MFQNGSPISLSGLLPLPQKKLRVSLSFKKYCLLYVNFCSKRKKIFLPKKKVLLCLRSLSSKNKNSLIQKKEISFLSYFLPFYNRFSHGNNICAILLKTKYHLFQNSVDSPSKQMAARFLMPKKPRNMIQKTCDKIK